MDVVKVVYVSTVILIFLYVSQLIYCLNHSGKINLVYYGKKNSLLFWVFNGVDNSFYKWPYFALTICFPFMISMLSLIFNLPKLEANTPLSPQDGMLHMGNILQVIIYISSSFLIILITVELGLISTVKKRIPELWNNILVTALIFDIVMFIIVSNLSWSMARDGTDDIWNAPPATIAAIFICTIASLCASLLVIFCVKLLDVTPNTKIEFEPKQN